MTGTHVSAFLPAGSCQVAGHCSMHMKVSTRQVFLTRALFVHIEVVSVVMCPNSHLMYPFMKGGLLHKILRDMQKLKAVECDPVLQMETNNGSELHVHCMQSVEAARECGMRAVVVAGRKPLYELGAADLVVRGLDELSFINLKQLFSDEESVEAHVSACAVQLYKCIRSAVMLRFGVPKRTPLIEIC